MNAPPSNSGPGQLAHERWRQSNTIPWLGVLFIATGLLIGLGLASLGAAWAPLTEPFVVIFPAGLLVLVLALLVLLAGLGLLRRRVWGWVLGCGIVISGALVLAIRLSVSGGGAELWGPLLTDLLIAFLLLRARPAQVF